MTNTERSQGGSIEMPSQSEMVSFSPAEIDADWTETDPVKLPMPPLPSLSPTLSSMPVEIHTYIISYLDPSSLASLTRTSSTFHRLHPVIEPYIWRDINFSNNPPSHRIESRIASMEESSTPTRLAMVRSLKLHPSSETFRLMATLFAQVSATLAELYVSAWNGEDHGDVQFFDHYVHNHIKEAVNVGLGGTPFSALTHLAVVHGSFASIQFIFSICDSATELTPLSFSVVLDAKSTGWRNGCEDMDYDSLQDMADRSPAFNTKNKLRQLQIAFDYPRAGWNLNDSHGPDDDSRCEFPPDDDSCYEEFARLTIANLFIHSPDLRQLSVQPGAQRDLFYGTFPVAMIRLSKLRDLHWSKHSYGRYPESEHHRLGSVRRFVITLSNVLYPTVETVPSGKEVNILHIYCPIYYVNDRLDLSRPLKPLDAKFAKYLRANPKLRLLNFFRQCRQEFSDLYNIFPQLDEMERSGTMSCQIRSYRSDGKEVLHVRLRVQCASSREVNPDKTRRRFLYIAGAQAMLKEKYAYVSAPSWQELSDYKGAPVPSEILARMREVEGLTEEVWDRVDVGAEAWKVLTDWEGEEEDEDETDDDDESDDSE